MTTDASHPVLPDIPEDATRIRVARKWPYCDLWYLNAADVHRYFAEQQTELEPADMETATGPHLLHTGSSLTGSSLVPGEQEVAVWSDGLLTRGLVHPPFDQRMGEQWTDRPRAFAAVERLLVALLSATNRSSLTPEMWMPWADSRAHAERPGTEIQRVERALAVDMTAARVLETVEHTVTLADGTLAMLWEARSRTTTTDTGRLTPGTRTMLRRASFHLSEAEALTALERWREDYPPLVTRAEAAALVGTTPAAFAQAITRATRSPLPPVGTPLHPMPLVTATAHWYDPRRCIRWWPSRPGHGPGRGRKAPVVPN